LVTTIVRSRAAAPVDPWSASGSEISAPPITTSIDSGSSSCHNQNQAKASTMAAVRPRLRRVRMTDRLAFSSSKSVLKASSRPNGIQTVQSEDEQRSNGHDYGEDGQHQPSPNPGLTGWPARPSLLAEGEGR
jgi:hypothetical protein